MLTPEPVLRGTLLSSTTVLVSFDGAGEIVVVVGIFSPLYAANQNTKITLT